MIGVILTSNLKALMLQLPSSAIRVTLLATRARIAHIACREAKLAEVAVVEGKLLEAETLADLKATKVMGEEVIEVVVVVAVKVVKEEIIIIILTCVIFVRTASGRPIAISPDFPPLCHSFTERATEAGTSVAKLVVATLRMKMVLSEAHWC